MSQIEVEQIAIGGEIYYIDLNTGNVWTEDGARIDADPVAVYDGIPEGPHANGTYSGDVASLRFVRVDGGGGGNLSSFDLSAEFDKEGIPEMSPAGISPGHSRNTVKPSPPGFGEKPAAVAAARAAARAAAAATAAANFRHAVRRRSCGKSKK